MCIHMGTYVCLSDICDILSQHKYLESYFKYKEHIIVRMCLWNSFWWTQVALCFLCDEHSLNDLPNDCLICFRRTEQ